LATEKRISRRPSRRPARDEPRRARRDATWWHATLVLVGIATLAIAVVSFGFHPIGDYFTESDFYGAYAQGAALIRHGHFDVARYGVYGPVYEVVLAVVGAIARDDYTAARLISVLSAGALLAAAAWTARRRLGAAAAFVLALFIAVNATFFRYGYSVGTDMLASSLAVVSMALLLSREGAVAATGAGALAGLATLTRYNLVSFVPAGLVVLGCATAPWRGRLVRAAAFAAACAAIVVPFTWYAVAAGHPPGATLAGDANFYMSDATSMAETRYRTLAVPNDSSRVAAREAGPGAARSSERGLASRTLARLVTGIPSHLAHEAHDLLGWPTAGLVVLGLALLLVRRSAAPLLPFAPYAALGFLALAPIYYSERYSYVLLPCYLAPAALAVAAWSGSRARPVAWLLAAVGAAASLRDNVSLQSVIYQSIPTEALSAARAIRAVARPGERVLARKAHVAWEAGLEPVAFPDVTTLDSLAAFCRARNARYLYYSWFESRMRPQFAFLLDTSLAVPGLEPLLVTPMKPSVTYRIGPDFDATSWDLSSAIYVRRASAALAAGRVPEGLALADHAARLVPRNADAQLLRGEAFTRLGHPREALAAFDRALELRPGDVPAQLGRGYSLMSLGRRDEAAVTWRPVIDATRNTSVLRAMLSVYTEVGDGDAARAVGAALERRIR